MQVIKSAHNNVMTCCDVSDDGNTLLSCSNGFDGAGCELKVNYTLDPWTPGPLDP